jgi:hypothetical protein
MHRESVYVCTYAQGSERVVGRVRAWDGREAAQLFAVELEAEMGGRIGPREVTVEERILTPVPSRRRSAPRRSRR